MKLTWSIIQAFFPVLFTKWCGYICMYIHHSVALWWVWFIPIKYIQFDLPGSLRSVKSYFMFQYVRTNCWQTMIFQWWHISQHGPSLFEPSTKTTYSSSNMILILIRLFCSIILEIITLYVAISSIAISLFHYFSYIHDAEKVPSECIVWKEVATHTPL